MGGTRVAQVTGGMARAPVLLTILARIAVGVSHDAHATPAAHRRAHRAAPPARPVFPLPDATRLMLVAPHPDDDMLGAGGLMQRVLETGGTVRVVYLTDGDGDAEGV